MCLLPDGRHQFCVPSFRGENAVWWRLIAAVWSIQFKNNRLHHMTAVSFGYQTAQALLLLRGIPLFQPHRGHHKPRGSCALSG